ncbi:hypothetical protein BH23GEM1_BH23GEM1_00630 [soil metagenome]
MQYRQSGPVTEASQGAMAGYTRERPAVPADLLVDLVPRAKRAALRLAVVGAFAALVGLFVIRISEEVRAPFTVLPPSGGAGALAPAVTIIDQTFASPGDDVMAGQPIMRVRSPELVRLLTSAEEATAAYSLFVTKIAPGYEARIASLRASIETLFRERQVLASLQTEQADGQRVKERQAEREVAENQRKYDQAQELIRSGWISRDDLRASVLALQRAETALDEFRVESRQRHSRTAVEMLQVDASIRGTEREITALQAESANAAARIRRDQQSARQLRDAALVQNTRVEGETVVLTAPRDGRLSFRAEIGETVEPNRPLFHIDPSVGPWRVRIITTQDDLVRLSKPLEVRLRFSSFAYLKYGEVTAQPTIVSPDPLDATKRIILAELPDTLPFPKHSGMSGSARLIGKRRTALGVIMEKLSRR